MPRELKGRSPQMPKASEKVSLVKALETLHNLFNKWGVQAKGYILVDEFAYLLQGYEVIATEVESGHLDVYADPQQLPWKDKGERSIIPPKDSRQMEDWVNFMQRTGFSLDILRAKPEILERPSVNYPLPSGGFIRLMKAYEMTEAFVEQTLMHYSLSDVGKEKIKEWVDKLKLIQEAAEKKNDEKTAKFCKDKLIECQKKWQDIL